MYYQYASFVQYSNPQIWKSHIKKNPKTNRVTCTYFQYKDNSWQTYRTCSSPGVEPYRKHKTWQKRWWWPME